MDKLSFKYLPVNTPERIAFFNQLLIKNELWFPSPERFNDPNEFRVQLRAPKRKSIIRQQYFADNSEASEQDFESWYGSVSWRSWHIYQEPRIQRDLLGNLGVLCLSRTCRDPIMWAHYASGHTGICIAFNIDFHVEIENVILAESVLYRKHLPQVKYFGEDQTKVLRKLLLTKYTGWAYEKEYRVIISKGDVTKQIAPTNIDGIILGMRVSRETEDQILEMIAMRQSPVKVLRAHLSYLTYEMDVPNCTSYNLSNTDMLDYR